MNTKALEMKMLEKDVSVDQLCEAAGMCRASFYRKIKGERQFLQQEIKAIAELLELTDSEIREIFFTAAVS